jgi:thiamine biosynthesis lipoprotein
MLEGKTMGTTYHVKIVARSPEESARIVALQGEIDARLEQVNDEMSTYRDESELSRFNRHASSEPFPASVGLTRVMARAKEIGALTDGTFDVTIGPLIELWGFDKGGPRAEPPSEEEMQKARARTGLEKLVVGDGVLTKTAPDLFVNLSGIAKGYGVDVVHDLLVERGQHAFMVEIGGEVRTRGKNADGEDWRIGINVPRSDADPEAVFRAVVLGEKSMATSGSYRNFFESGGKRYTHILDPRTSAPIETRVVSASVVAPDCMTADGLATAAMILDVDGVQRAISRVPNAAALLVVEEVVDGKPSYRVETTPGFPTTIGD